MNSTFFVMPDLNTKTKILEKLSICRETILKMHVEDETNRDAKKLKADMLLVHRIKRMTNDNTVDIPKLQELNRVYAEYKKWETHYE